MFELINRRASIGLRAGLIAVCAAPPIALLLYLFVAQVSQGIDYTRQEMVGAEYISEIWPAIAPPTGRSESAVHTTSHKAGDARDVAFGTVTDARAFAAAGADTKIAAGVALIRAIGDGSRLTLDTDLSSYYAMDAATVKLPRLMAAVDAAARAAGPEERAFAMGQVANFADASAYDLRQSIAHDSTGGSRRALSAHGVSLAETVRRFREQPAAAAALAGGLQQEIDRTWRADLAELTRLLRVREAKLRVQLAVNLSLVTVSLCFAAVLMIATMRGMMGRLRGLLRTMDRLNEGDTAVDIPYLSDSHETGQIAATLKAFKQGQIEAVEERQRVEAANAALRESEARYRLLADNTSDVILRFDLEGRMVYASPSVRQFGYQPENLVGGVVGSLVHLDDRELALKLFADAIEGRPTARGEWRIQSTAVRWYWMEGRPEPILDETGARIGILVVMRNVDDRKAAELALREVNAELMRVARVSALGAFATSIAHEINQPIAAVVTNSEASMRWLAQTPSNVEMAVEAMNRAARDARRASEVVSRMRSLVARQEFRDAEFDLDEAIVEVLLLTQSERQHLKVETRLELSEGGREFLATASNCSRSCSTSSSTPWRRCGRFR